MNRIKSAVVVLLVLFLISTAILISQTWGTEDSWTTLEPMPTARSGHGVTVVDGMIYVMGGEFGRGPITNNEVYDPQSNIWTSCNSIPTPRSSFGIVNVENKIYIIGGSTTSIGSTGLNEVYDSLTDTWEVKTSMPTARANVVANEVEGKIYVMAGCTFPHPSFPTLCNKTEVYNPVNDSWSDGAEMPDFTGLGMAENVASTVIDNIIYVTVGEALYIYNTIKDSWSLGASVPDVIHGGAFMGATTGESAPKRLYLFGGYGYSYGNTLNLTRVYDPEENVWSYGEQLLTPRFGSAVAVLNDKMYVIGGIVGDNVSFYAPTALNERYTPSNNITEFPIWVLLVAGFFAIILLSVVYRTQLKQRRRK